MALAPRPTDAFQAKIRRITKDLDRELRIGKHPPSFRNRCRSSEIGYHDMRARRYAERLMKRGIQGLMEIHGSAGHDEDQDYLEAVIKQHVRSDEQTLVSAQQGSACASTKFGIRQLFGATLSGLMNDYAWQLEDAKNDKLRAERKEAEEKAKKKAEDDQRSREASKYARRTALWCVLLAFVLTTASTIAVNYLKPKQQTQVHVIAPIIDPTDATVEILRIKAEDASKASR